jgi:hypothetical protein
VDRKKLEIIITTVLVLILIVLLVNTFKSGRSPDPASGVAAGPGAVSAPGFEAREVPREYSNRAAEWGRDPFYPVNIRGGADVASELELNGIIWDEKNPYAIINDEVLIEGDRIEGYDVVRIEEKRVILRSSTEELALQMSR